MRRVNDKFNSWQMAGRASAIALESSETLIESLPPECRNLADPQTDLPKIAKDKKLVSAIEQTVHRLPTEHDLYLGDALVAVKIKPNSVHLVLTSPPYWTLEEYRRSTGQLGHIEDYRDFLRLCLLPILEHRIKLTL
jgi:hypothetical protein